MKPRFAIVNIRTNSNPIGAIRYFKNPKKLTATYDGLELGTADGKTAAELAELLLAGHHDPRAARCCRTAVISVKTPKNASKAELDEIDQRLLRCAKDFQRYFKIISMLGFCHGNTMTRHMHCIWPNSTGRRTLNITPKILRDLQGLEWTVEFLSGRGKGRRTGLSFNPKAPKLAIRTLALALFDAKGKFNESRWHKMVKSGAISDFRQRRDGSIISFVFQNRRIRHSTLNNFRKGLDMTTIINPAGGLPDALVELLNASGYTSADVQEVLQDIREAQGHVSAGSKTVENVNPSTPTMDIV